MNVSLSNKVTWLLVAVLGLSLLTVGAYAVREQESLALVLSPGPMTVAVSRIGQTISMAGLGILFMGLLLGGLAIRSILGRPIKQLVDGADRVVCQGDLTHRIGINRADEIGHLAKAINTLADELRGSMLKDQALTRCVDPACQPHEILPQEGGQAQRSDAVDFIQEHIEHSGGKFWVESDQGMNPVFHFTVPDQDIEAYQQEIREACK